MGHSTTIQLKTCMTFTLDVRQDGCFIMFGDVLTVTSRESVNPDINASFPDFSIRYNMGLSWHNRK